jgi:hypothetical protein
MQLKPITAIIVLLLVVASLLVAGCTTSTTSNTNQTPSKSAASATNVADGINAAFTKAGLKVITPFVKTTVNGNTAYTGVVDDGAKILQPYRHNVTMVLTPDRVSANKAFNASIAQALANGYTTDQNSSTGWVGRIGSLSYPNQKVMIELAQPSLIGVMPWGIPTVIFDVGNTDAYTVSINYQSPTS